LLHKRGFADLARASHDLQELARLVQASDQGFGIGAREIGHGGWIGIYSGF